VVAAPGPAAPVLIEGYAGRSRADLARAARRPLPSGGPPTLRISDADGHLSMFNLSTSPVTDAVVSVPGRRLFRGVQTVSATGVDLVVSLAAGAGRVEPPRFTVEGSPAVGTRFQVTDSHHVVVTAPAGRRPVAVTLRAGSWSTRVRVPAGASRSITVPGGPVTPTADLARGRTTFPTSPLPAGMSDPHRAVDGDSGTSWRPGPTGRMVVDLGAAHPLTAVRLTWSRGRRRPVRVETSTDGLAYAPAVLPGTSGRYVAVVVTGWRRGDAELVEVAVS
jgi:hypothetical protein